MPSAFLALFNIAKKFSLLDLEQNGSIREFQILIQNHGLTPFEKFNMATSKIERVKNASFRQFLQSLTS